MPPLRAGGPLHESARGILDAEMFSRHRRKARVLFGLSDILLTAVAFTAAYESRVLLPLERNFYLPLEVRALLLGVSLLAWLGMGLWLNVYERLDAGNPQVILRDSFHQSLLGMTCLVIFQYMLRLDLSRPFLGLFGAYAWVLLCVFRLTAGRVVVAVRRGTPNYVMVVGTGESAMRLGAALEGSAKFGIRLIGFLADDEEPAPDLIRLGGEYKVHALAELPMLLRRQVIDEILFAVDSKSLAGLEDVLAAVRRRRRAHARAGGLLPARQQRRLPGPAGTDAAADLLRRARTTRSGCWSSGCTDVVVAAVALVVLAPFMACVAILDPAYLARPGDFPAGALRSERPAVHVLQVPLDVRERRGAEGSAAAPEPASRRRSRLPNDPRLTPVGRGPAQVLDRRMAAIVERAEGRHVAGGAAAGGSRRGGAVQGLAAAAAAHASRADLPVGPRRPRPTRFRDLDEDGHAVHRQLVAGVWTGKSCCGPFPACLSGKGAIND